VGSAALTPTEIVRAYLDAFSTGEPDTIAAFVAEDFVNEHTAALGSGCVGRATYRERLPAFLASMPMLRYEVDDVTADGDRVWAGYTLRARVNDRPIAVRGAMRFTVTDGHIGHRTDYWDSKVFLQQAGLE
jgi:steroid delta-isomerase-like uncharacterized protein